MDRRDILKPIVLASVHMGVVGFFAYVWGRGAVSDIKKKAIAARNRLATRRTTESVTFQLQERGNA